MSKKKIFAIIIFIVFGLFMFSFANPIEVDENSYGEVEVDKSKLKDAINRGTELIEKYGTDSDLLKKLDDAVNDGKDVYDDESTQKEVDDATKEIEDAIKALEDDIMNRANIQLYPNTLEPSEFVNMITTVTILDNKYIDSVKFVVGTNCYANGTNLVLDFNNQAVTRVTANTTYTSCLFLTNGTVKQASQTINNIAITNPDKEPPVISLNGKELIKIVLGKTTYEDELAKVIDNVDEEREIAGELVGNTDKAGTYEFKYNAKDTAGNEAEEVVRTVKVLDPKGDEDKDGFTNEEEVDAETDFDDPESYPETLAPEITLKGENPYVMLQNKNYVEAGVEIKLDSHDDITKVDDVVITSELDTTKVGTYTIKYTITDRYGKSASVERTVKVLDPQGDEDEDGFTNEEEMEKPKQPVNPNEPEGPNNPLEPTNPTNPEDKDEHPETYAPVIVLKGENPYVMLQNRNYEEAGVEIKLDSHDDITTVDDVVITSELDTTQVGTYTIKYTITDRYGKSASVERTVKVLDPQGDEDEDGFTNEEEMEKPKQPVNPNEPEGPNNPLEPTNPTNPEDKDEHPETYAPVIVLKGENPYVMLQNKNYVEAGVEIKLDSHDDITTVDDVVITSELDTTQVGTYTIKYTITDRYGKSASVERTVKVLDPQGDEDEDGFTNEEEIEKPKQPVNPNEPEGPNNPLEPTNPTNPEDKDEHPETYMPSISLIGSTPVYVEVNSEYVEAGVEIKLDSHDNITTINDVVTIGAVDTSKLGETTITYTITDRYGKSASVSRLVIVRDTQKPVITLNGSSEITIERGSIYNELGANVEDNYDNNLEVTITSEIDTNTLGTYYVKYNAKDSSGNEAIEVVRTVIVARSENDKMLNRIEATLEKTEYKRGEPIETLKVTAYDNDGTSYDVTNVSGHDFDSTTVGNKTLTVAYNGKTDTVDYIVVRNDEDKKIVSISAVLNPTTYDRGTINYGNLIVTATDKDNTKHVLETSEYTVTGWDSSLEVGKESINRDLTITLNSDNTVNTKVGYTIVRSENDKALSRIEATLEKTEYKRGESIETLKVTAYDNDGTSYDITNVSNHDFDSATVGNKTLTVTYKEKTDTVDYIVVRNDEDKKIVSISAELDPTTYDRGTINYGNLIVTATDKDNTEHVLETSEYTVTGWDSSLEVGKESINRDLTITLNSDNTVNTKVGYTIVRSENDKAIKELTAVLEKDVYKRGEEMSNIVVTRIDNDGTQTILNSTQYTVEGFQTETVGGPYTVVVKHDGKMATDTYTVGDIEVNISTPILNVSGKKAEPGQTVDYEISLSTDMTYVTFPTYTVEIAEGMKLESCPTNATCSGNTITWTPTSINDKLSYTTKVDTSVSAGSVIKTTIKENDKVVKEFDTNIEVTVEISTSSTSATSLEVVLTLDVSGSMWEEECTGWGIFKDCTSKPTKITDLANVTNRFIENLNNKNTNNSTINLTIITFGRRKDNKCFNNGTCFETLYTGSLTSTTLDNIKTKVNSIIGTEPNNGGTHLYGALNNALSVINNSTLNNKYLVVLGDGEPTDSDKYNVINNLKSTSANVFSIGFKVGVNSNAEQVLKSVVNNNTEHYFSADNTTSLENSFSTIQNNINTESVQTVNGNVEALAINAKSIEISHSGMDKITITDLTETGLAKYNIKVVDGKYVWDVSKYPGYTNYKMIVNY